MTSIETETLAGFLLARIADDEALLITGDCYCPDGTVQQRPDCPDRIAAEVEAKRRIIDWAFANAAQIDGEWGDACLEADLRAGRCDNYGMWAVEEVLSKLALPYAGHPDYRQEWAP